MYLSITHRDDIGYSFDKGCTGIAAGIGKVADFCLRSKIFSLLTLGHLHTLIHELGHAVAHRVVTGGEAIIELTTASCYGQTILKPGPRPPSQMGETWIDLSGPLADILFSAVLIVGIFALTHFVPMPQAASLGLRIAIAAPAAFWILGELFYAAVSAAKMDHGDFGKIANRGWAHLIFSIAFLLSICAAAAVGVAFLI
jgi:hypothetical protein